MVVLSLRDGTRDPPGENERVPSTFSSSAGSPKNGSARVIKEEELDSGPLFYVAKVEGSVLESIDEETVSAKQETQHGINNEMNFLHESISGKLINIESRCRAELERVQTELQDSQQSLFEKFEAGVKSRSLIVTRKMEDQLQHLESQFDQRVQSIEENWNNQIRKVEAQMKEQQTVFEQRLQQHEQVVGEMESSGEKKFFCCNMNSTMQ